MSNFTNILLTYVQNKSQQLEILHFIYSVLNNLSYGKLLVIKGSPVDKNSSKYVKREMDYDNLVNEIKKQCGTKCCTLKGLTISERRLEKSDGLMYFKYYEDGEKLSDLEYFATKNNVILLADNDVTLNIKTCVTVTIDKLTLNIDYTIEELKLLSITADTKVKFFDFLNSYKSFESPTSDKPISSELLLQNTRKLQLELETQLETALDAKLKLETQLSDISKSKTELESQLEFTLNDKSKLASNLLDVSQSKSILETELFETLEAKLALASELETLKTPKPTIVVNTGASKIPRFNPSTISAKKPIGNSTLKSKINPIIDSKTNTQKQIKPIINSKTSTQKQINKPNQRCTF